MSEFNEPLDFRDGKPWIVFVDEGKRIAHIETIDYRIRQNAGIPHDGPSRYFAGYPFDQFALRSVDLVHDL